MHDARSRRRSSPLPLIVLLVLAGALLAWPAAAATLTIRWNDNATNETGYRVERRVISGSFAKLVDTGANATSYTDATVLTGYTYCYRVQAYNGAGGSAFTGESCAAPSTSGTSTPPPSGGSSGGSSGSTSGLVAGYGFDEGSGSTARDSSGRGLTGTLSGPTWTSGRSGSSLSFDGSNDVVTVADNSALDLTTAFTLSAWVYPTASGGYRSVILKEASGGLAYSLYSQTGNGSPGVYVTINGQEVGAIATGPLPLNAWSHLAATYNGAALRVFVNATQVANRPLTGAVVATGGALRMGGNAVWGEYFRGQIDEVRVYNRALASSEIQASMAVAVSSGNSYTLAPASSGVIGVAGLGTRGTLTTGSMAGVGTRACQGACAGSQGARRPTTTGEPPPGGSPSTPRGEEPTPPGIAIGSGPGQAPEVRTFSDTGTAADHGWPAFSEAATGGVFVALADVDGNGQTVVVTGSGPGVPGEVSLHDLDGGSTGVTFRPYGDSYKGGVRVAACDVDGDGRAEVVTAPGAGSTASVTAWKYDRSAFTPLVSVPGAGSSSKQGTFVACGDVDGDGRGEIVTGIDNGRNPEVAVYGVQGSRATRTLGFLAFDPADAPGGVRVATVDVDGDGRLEVVATPGPGGRPLVSVFQIEGQEATLLGTFESGDPDFRGGLFVAAGRMGGDGAQVATVPGPGGEPFVRLFELTATGALETIGFPVGDPAGTSGFTVGLAP